MPLYIEKINGDANRPTNRPTNRVNIEQSAFFESRKKRKKAEICNCSILILGSKQMRVSKRRLVTQWGETISIPISGLNFWFLMKAKSKLQVQHWSCREGGVHERIGWVSSWKDLMIRSSWLNCAVQDDEAVYWVSVGHYEAVAVGNWW